MKNVVAYFWYSAGFVWIFGQSSRTCRHAARMARKRAVWSGAGPICSPRRRSATKHESRATVPRVPSCASSNICINATKYRAISRRCSPRRSFVASSLHASGSGAFATRKMPAPTRCPCVPPPTKKSGRIETVTPSMSMASKFGDAVRAILRIPNAFSLCSNSSIISMHRNASSRAFGLMPTSAAFMVNASLTRIRISGERRGSPLYSRSALIASPLAVTIGGRENLQSCSTFCCPSGRIIKYSAKAAADIRGFARTRTD